MKSNKMCRKSENRFFVIVLKYLKKINSKTVMNINKIDHFFYETKFCEKKIINSSKIIKISEQGAPYSGKWDNFD